MNPIFEDYKDWNKLLKFLLSDMNGFEITKQELLGETETITFVKEKESIKIGIIDKELIFIHRNHSETTGFNKYQELEYYHEFDFHPEKDYGGPGLKFERNNIEGIINELQQGVRGEEIQFRTETKLVKSDVYLELEEIGKTKIFSYKTKNAGIFKRMKQLLNKQQKGKNTEKIILSFQDRFEKLRTK